MNPENDVRFPSQNAGLLSSDSSPPPYSTSVLLPVPGVITSQDEMKSFVAPTYPLNSNNFGSTEDSPDEKTGDKKKGCCNCGSSSGSSSGDNCYCFCCCESTHHGHHHDDCCCDCDGCCECGDCNCGDCDCGDCNCGDCDCGAFAGLLVDCCTGILCIFGACD